MTVGRLMMIMTVMMILLHFIYSSNYVISYNQYHQYVTVSPSTYLVVNVEKPGRRTLTLRVKWTHSHALFIPQCAPGPRDHINSGLTRLSFYYGICAPIARIPVLSSIRFQAESSFSFGLFKKSKRLIHAVVEQCPCLEKLD